MTVLLIQNNVDNNKEPIDAMDFIQYVAQMHTNQDYLFSEEFTVCSVYMYY